MTDREEGLILVGAGTLLFDARFELQAIAAVVIGGTLLTGGFGSVMCAVVGAFILGIVSTSLNMLGLSPDIQTIVKGGITLIAILSQRFALDRRTT